MYSFKMIDYKLSAFSRNITFFSQIKVYAISQKRKKNWSVSNFFCDNHEIAVLKQDSLYLLRFFTENYTTSEAWENFFSFFSPSNKNQDEPPFSVWSCLIWQSNVVIRRKINEITCSHPLLIQVRLTASHKTR